MLVPDRISLQPVVPAPRGRVNNLKLGLFETKLTVRSKGPGEPRCPYYGGRDLGLFTLDSETAH